METSRRHRSPAYPGIDLKSAIDRARQFFQKEGKHKATIATAAGHWGYSETSSTRLTTIAALKSYGLMVDSGEGLDRMVAISPLGLAIVQDERQISTEREAKIREAALLPRTMADLWDKYGVDLPSDDTLAHYLKTERDFNPKSVGDVIQIYKDNVAFARLDESEHAVDTEHEESEPKETSAEVATKTKVFTQSSTAVGEEIANIRVARDCTIRLMATGPYSRKSIEALVAQLKLGLDLGTYDDLKVGDVE